MTLGLTTREAEALTALKRLTVDAIAPSRRELADALGLKSTGGPQRLINSLERKGYVRRLPGLARAIEVIPQSKGPSAALVEAVHVLCSQAAGEATVPTYAAIRESLADAMGGR